MCVSSWSLSKTCVYYVGVTVFPNFITDGALGSD